VFKKPDQRRSFPANPGRVLIGFFLFFVGSIAVLANLFPSDGGSLTPADGDILNPFVWGAASLYGIVIMVWGALEGRGD